MSFNRVHPGPDDSSKFARLESDGADETRASNIKAFDGIHMGIQAGLHSIKGVKAKASSLYKKLFGDSTNSTRRRKAVQQRQRFLTTLVLFFSLILKFVFFVGINISLLLWIFWLARYTERVTSTSTSSNHLSTSYSLTLTTCQDSLSSSIPACTDKASAATLLKVDDYLLPTNSRGVAPATIGAYTSNVHLPTDPHGHPGWNLQDIVGLPRAIDTQDEYSAPLAGGGGGGVERMVQNYGACSIRCLLRKPSLPSIPIDLSQSARDYSFVPYGQDPGDFYLNRTMFLASFDPDWFAAFQSGYGPSLGPYFSHWGLSPKYIPNSPILNTTPTGSRHICNLGAPRRTMRSLVIKTMSCHVQIASHKGSDYRIYIRGNRLSSIPSIAEVDVEDAVSGCQSFDLEVQATSEHCPLPKIPGQRTSCDKFCTVVLLKGQYSRRIPIQVVASLDSSVDGSSFKIDDKYLVLDTTYPWGGNLGVNASRKMWAPDLWIGGGKIHVELANAFVANLTVDAHVSEVTSSFLRTSTVLVNSSFFDPDVSIEDDRNAILLHRNVNNYLCVTAPLVEQIPDDFLACDSASTTQPTADTFFDTTIDGVIDRNEFSSGLSRLGVDLNSTALGLTSDQQTELINFVFSVPDPSQPFQDLAPAELARRLRILFPPFVTLFDSQLKQSCVNACTQNLSSVPGCNSQCTWICKGSPIGITDPNYGLCDPDQGCHQTCGSPDWPMERYNTATNQAALLFNLFLDSIDVNGDGLIGHEELRGLLLHLYGNCTYRVLQSDPSVSSSMRFCSITGVGEFQPGQGRGLGPLNCSFSSGNPHDWRINNLPPPTPPPGSNLNSTVYADLISSAYGLHAGYLPNECRPFPDYDPKLSGKSFDPHASRESCPECFLLDGTRAPPHYYNRSTWSNNQYDSVMAYVRQIFTPKDVSYEPFPYFNISDDVQYGIFVTKVFSPLQVTQRVSYSRFNTNIQSLRSLLFLGNKRFMFNPQCFDGQFLKLGPTYQPGNSSYNSDQITSNSVQYSADGSSLITSSNLPGFNESTVPQDTTILPCPPSYGNGVQLSTNFSYFSWANASIGFKWGQSIPPFCLDERWPNGGVNGSYPKDPSVYGPLSGLPILPGCEPRACLPTFRVINGLGSIRVQSLPFTFQPWNETGDYQRMVENCMDFQGKPRCFYKGYDDQLDATLTPKSKEAFASSFQPCLSGAETCADLVANVMVTGAGVPTHQSLFWASRKVYVQIEPAYWFLISSGTIGPDFTVMRPKMSPGFCDARMGAVEKLDWRDYATVGQDSTTMVALRNQRSSIVFESLVKSLPGDLPLNSGWFLKRMWRKPFRNESLFFSSLTTDGESDTSPGYYDISSGSTVRKGAFWRHKLACVPSTSCQQYFIYNDTCKVARVAQSNSNPASWSLSPCIFPNGTKAYLDSSLGDSGPTFNETSYSSQFPTPVTGYPWFGSVDGMDYEAHIRRNFYSFPYGFGADNVTSYFYSKDIISLGSDGSVGYTPSDSPSNTYLALSLTLLLSVAISLLCGLLITCLGIFFGLRYLSNQATTMEIVAKAKAQHLVECTSKLYDKIVAEKLLLIAKEMESMHEAKVAKVDDPDIEDELVGFMSGAPTKAAEAKNQGKKKKQGQLFAEEKLEILYVMNRNGYSAGNVMQWNIDDMVKVWREELEVRKEENRLPDAKGGLGEPPVDPVTEQKRLAEEQRTDKEKERRLAITGGILIQTVRATKKRALRVIRGLISIFLTNLPSPFKVIDTAIIRTIIRWAINSLSTFFRAKCILTHQLAYGETIVLGSMMMDQLRDARKETRLKSSLVHKKLGKLLNSPLASQDAPKGLHDALKGQPSDSQGLPDDQKGIGRSLSAARLHLSAARRHLSGFLKNTIKSFGNKDPFTIPEPLPEDEVERSKYKGDEEEQPDKPHYCFEGLDDEESDLGDATGPSDKGRAVVRVVVDPKGGYKELYACKFVRISTVKVPIEIRTDMKEVVKDVLSGRLLVDLVKRLTRFWTSLLALFGIAPSPAATGAADDKFALIVVVQEGPGAVMLGVDFSHEEEDEEMLWAETEQGVDPSVQWKRRIFALPLPLSPSDGGARLTYRLMDASGPSYITIDSSRAHAAVDDDEDQADDEEEELSEKDVNAALKVVEEGLRHRPVMEFQTSFRSLDNTYEHWCNYHDLIYGSMVDQETMMEDLGIRLLKKVVKQFRGLRLKRTGLSIAEEKAMAADDGDKGEKVQAWSEQWRDATVFFALARPLDLGDDGSLALMGHAASKIDLVTITSSSCNTHYLAQKASRHHEEEPNMVQMIIDSQRSGQDPHPLSLCHPPGSVTFLTSTTSHSNGVSYRVAVYSSHVVGEVEISLVSNDGRMIQAACFIDPPRHATTIKAGRMDLISFIGPDIGNISKIIVTIPTSNSHGDASERPSLIKQLSSIISNGSQTDTAPRIMALELLRLSDQSTEIFPGSGLERLAHKARHRDGFYSRLKAAIIKKEDEPGLPPPIPGAARRRIELLPGSVVAEKNGLSLYKIIVPAPLCESSQHNTTTPQGTRRANLDLISLDFASQISIILKSVKEHQPEMKLEAFCDCLVSEAHGLHLIPFFDTSPTLLDSSFSQHHQSSSALLLGAKARQSDDQRQSNGSFSSSHSSVRSLSSLPSRTQREKPFVQTQSTIREDPSLASSPVPPRAKDGARGGLTSHPAHIGGGGHSVKSSEDPIQTYIANQVAKSVQSEPEGSERHLLARFISEECVITADFIQDVTDAQALSSAYQEFKRKLYNGPSDKKQEDIGVVDPNSSDHDFPDTIDSQEPSSAVKGQSLGATTTLTVTALEKVRVLPPGLATPLGSEAEYNPSFDNPLTGGGDGRLPAAAHGEEDLDNSHQSHKQEPGLDASRSKGKGYAMSHVSKISQVSKFRRKSHLTRQVSHYSLNAIQPYDSQPLADDHDSPGAGHGGEEEGKDRGASTHALLFTQSERNHIASFGLRYEEDETYELLGVIVNQKEMSDDPSHHNRLAWVLIDLVNVLVHTFFIWIISLPLAIACIGYQDVYEATTAMEQVLTFPIFRLNPTSIQNFYFETFLVAVAVAALVWLGFCYFELCIYYIAEVVHKLADQSHSKGMASGSGWFQTTCGVMLRVSNSLFWIFLIFMFSIHAAYTFEVICWLILGAVVNPNKYLPYSVAAITLLLHARTTYVRLMANYESLRVKFKAIVMAAFSGKLQSALQLANEATESLGLGRVADQVIDVAGAELKEVMVRGQGAASGLGVDLMQFKEDGMAKLSEVKGQALAAKDDMVGKAMQYKEDAVDKFSEMKGRAIAAKDEVAGKLVQYKEDGMAKLSEMKSQALAAKEDIGGKLVQYKDDAMTKLSEIKSQAIAAKDEVSGKLMQYEDDGMAKLSEIKSQAIDAKGDIESAYAGVTAGQATIVEGSLQAFKPEALSLHTISEGKVPTFSTLPTLPSGLLQSSRRFFTRGRSSYSQLPTHDIDDPYQRLMHGKMRSDEVGVGVGAGVGEVDAIKGKITSAVDSAPAKVFSMFTAAKEKAKSPTMKPYQIFALYAEKKSGCLKYDPGFIKLLDHLEVKMNGEKRRQLFVRFSGENSRMSYKEFELCYEAIQDMIVEHTLKLKGITKGRLIALLIYAISILLLIFVFIFVGVAAFTGAGTLGAIVNSLLAAGSGIALNLKGQKEGAEADKKETVKIGDKEYTSDGKEESNRGESE